MTDIDDLTPEPSLPLARTSPCGALSKTSLRVCVFNSYCSASSRRLARLFACRSPISPCFEHPANRRDSTHLATTSRPSTAISPCIPTRRTLHPTVDHRLGTLHDPPDRLSPIAPLSRSSAADRHVRCLDCCTQLIYFETTACFFILALIWGAPPPLAVDDCPLQRASCASPELCPTAGPLPYAILLAARRRAAKRCSSRL